MRNLPLTVATCVLGCLLAASPTLAQPTAGSLKDIQRLLDAGKPDDAMAALGPLEQAAAASGDRKTLAGVHLLRGNVYWNRAALDDCDREAKAAEQFAKGLDAGAEAQALWLQGNVASSRGDEKARLALLLRAQPLAKQAADGRRQAMVEDGFCRAYMRLDITQAVPHCDQAIVAADKGGDTEFMIMSRALKATILLGTSRLDEGLGNAQDAYDMARQRQDTPPRVRAAAIWTLAQANIWLRNLDVGVRLVDEAIEIYRKVGARPGLMRALGARQDALIPLAEFERAVLDGDEILKLEASQATGRTPERVSRQALAMARGGRPADALALIAEAEGRLETPRPDRDPQFLFNNLGLALLAADQPARAIPYFLDLIQVARRNQDIDFEWRAMYGHGRALLASGRPADAVPWFESAIRLSEHVRLQIPDVARRAAYMSDSVKIYDSLVEAILGGRSEVSDADAARTLEIAEAARGRAMADQIAEARMRSKDSGLRDLMKRETEWSGRLTTVQRKLLQASDAPERAALLVELGAVETDYANYVTRLRREEPAYAHISHPDRLSAPQIRAGLQPGDVFVEYLCSDSVGFAWVMSRDRLVVYRIPGRAALESSVRLLHSLVRAGDDAAVRRVGVSLFRQLLAPGQPVLAGATRLIIAPDGPLLRLPFALLSADGRDWLVQDYALSLAPSASILSQLSAAPRLSSAAPVLAFASAPGQASSRGAGVFEPGALPAEGLPNAAREAADVSSLFAGGSVRIGGDARERDVKTMTPAAYRILHFATHAIVDEVVPRRSAILLQSDQSDDGLLQLHEIAGLQLGADLVVLSACHSYSGRAIRGEGLASLGRAFLQAGARAVVASVWDVDDRTSPAMMRAFYAALAGGAAPDAALRTAQLQMIRAGGPNAATQAWAGFTVTGASGDPLFAPPASRRPAIAAALLLTAAGIPLLLMFRRGRRAS
jgi:CHAT domain-containing protein